VGKTRARKENSDVSSLTSLTKGAVVPPLRSCARSHLALRSPDCGVVELVVTEGGVCRVHRLTFEQLRGLAEDSVRLLCRWPAARPKRCRNATHVVVWRYATMWWSSYAVRRQLGARGRERWLVVAPDDRDLRYRSAPAHDVAVLRPGSRSGELTAPLPRGRAGPVVPAMRAGATSGQIRGRERSR
jgi:hypothetical protein